MHTLLGEDRHRVVEGLVTAFDEVERTGVPQWWSLEAPPGWGKTRLVQELFVRLAARQSPPAYWPPELVQAPAGEPGLPELVRKRVAPAPATVDARGTPEYFWWGLSCLSRPGSAFEALAQDLSQFTMHRDGLERRWRTLATRRERSRRQWRARRGEVAETAFEEGVAMAAQAANLAIPGLGLLMLLGRWGVERAGELQADPEQRVLPTARSVAEEVGPELERLGNAGLTLVVAVEDIHAADEALVDLLARLLVADGSRVLVISSSWPGLLSDASRPVHALVQRVVRHRVRAGVEVGPLSDVDRAALARAALSDLDEEGARLLARRYINPLAVQTACRLGAVRRSAARGTLGADVVAGLPGDVSGLYDELWDELPAGVREALSLAALSAPASVGQALSFGDERWDPAVLALALTSAPELLGPAREVLPDLGTAATAYAWVKTVEALLQQFDEPGYREVALVEAAREFAGDDRAALHAALARALTADARELEPARRRHADRLLLALAAAGSVPGDDPAVLAAADRVCDRLSASPAVADLEQVLDVTGAVDVGDLGDVVVLRLLRHRAAALAATGRVPAALEQLEPLIASTAGVLGPDAAETLAVRDLRGLCLTRCGRHADAVEVLTGVLADRTRVLGDDAPDTLATRAHLATALGGAGRTAAAVSAYAQLVPDLERVFGPDQAVSLRARSNHAWWVGELGRAEEAVAQYEALLPQVEHALGPDAPDTLTTRSNLANWLGESGRIAEAEALLVRLAADRARVLGPDAPDTLRARSNLAWWVGVGGRPEAALRTLQTLLADRTRVLGAEAPDTLRTRRYIARFTAETGSVDAGVTLLRALLAEQTRVLGPDAPEVAETAAELRRWA